MIDYKHNHSTHYSNDIDRRLYEFTRNSRLPRDTFNNGIDPDVLVFAGVVLIGVTVLALFMIGIIV